MADREDLETREAQCKSVDDFVALAREALMPPADREYAGELLRKGEMQCQFPGDYIKVAEAFALELKEQDYARDLYEQAENACFEGREFAELGHSLAISLGAQDKARELFEKAANQASGMADFLLLSRYAQEDLGDSEYARTLLDKIDAQCKSLEDFRALAESILKDQQDPQTAKAIYKKAARFAGDLETTIAYAEGMLRLFDDAAWARSTLEEAETDCQFTRQFIQLAEGYQRLLQDSSKVSALLEQAAEFAMTGEEQSQLAEGYWRLMKDQAAAVAAYERALAEITGTGELLALAKTIATEMGEKSLARKVYAKAEGKMTGVKDLIALAQAILADLGDRDLALEVYGRAEQKLSAPNELVTLAGEILKNLGDRERALAMYQRALAGTSEFAPLIKLLDSAQADLNDPGFARTVLHKATGAAQTTPEFLDLASRVSTLVQDQNLVGQLLAEAEERVTNLEEMRQVTAAVQAHLPEDAERVARVTEKLAKREQNQAKYTEFQKLEEDLKSFKQNLNLVDRVMAELADPFYARKLLTSAENRLAAEAYDFGKYQQMIVAVNRHLQDQAWLTRLYDTCARQSRHFSWLRQVCHSALHDLAGQELGWELARRYYQEWEKSLSERQDRSSYELAKLALAVYEDLADPAWRDRLLAEAEKIASDHFAFAHLGRILETTGEPERAQVLYKKAAENCTTGAAYVQLASQLREYGLAPELLKEIYAAGAEALKNPAECLRWAEGITDVLGDRDWAAQVYSQIADRFLSEVDKSRFAASRASRLERRFY
jgi:tetratricopeptide (TPR) repeat protein